MKRIFLFLTSLLLLASSYAQDRTDSLHIAHYDINLNITDFTNHIVYGYADLTAVAKVNNLPYDSQHSSSHASRPDGIG